MDEKTGVIWLDDAALAGDRLVPARGASIAVDEWVEMLAREGLHLVAIDRAPIAGGPYDGWRLVRAEGAHGGRGSVFALPPAAVANLAGRAMLPW